MRRSCVITFLSCLIVQPAFSQRESSPGLLIFDPILIQEKFVEPIVPELLAPESSVTDANDNNAEGERSLEYNELESLPNKSPQILTPLLPGNLESSRTQPEQVASAISFALSVDQYEKSILSLELEGGPYEARLSQELLALGNIYKQQGNQPMALEHFAKALHVNRINYGLYDLSQTPIVEEIIKSHLISGNLQTANDQQEYIFFLQNKAYDSDSPEFIAVLESYASWNLMAFTLPLGIVTAGSSEIPTFSLTADTFEDPGILQTFLIRRLINAQNAYTSINQILLNHYGYNDPRLLEVEQRIALINYLFADNFSSNFYNYSPSAINTGAMGYRYGREALERRIEYLQKMENVSSEELAVAFAELGDWYIIFRKRSAATDYYIQARQILLASDTPESRIKEILDTPYRVLIPDFLPPQFTRKANNIPEDIALNYKGYVDLEFIIDRYGIPTTINLLGKTANTSSAIEFQLSSQLRRTQFRPRVVEEKLVKNDHYTLRYYYSY